MTAQNWDQKAMDALANARDHMERAADRLDHLGDTDHAKRLRRAADECRAALSR
jgi:hypothetical protein